jgi:hypothetical protein
VSLPTYSVMEPLLPILFLRRPIREPIRMLFVDGGCALCQELEVPIRSQPDGYLFPILGRGHGVGVGSAGPMWALGQGGRNSTHAGTLWVTPAVTYLEGVCRQPSTWTSGTPGPQLDLRDACTSQ